MNYVCSIRAFLYTLIVQKQINYFNIISNYYYHYLYYSLYFHTSYDRTLYTRNVRFSAFYIEGCIIGQISTLNNKEHWRLTLTIIINFFILNCFIRIMTIVSVTKVIGDWLHISDKTLDNSLISSIQKEN